MPTADDYYKCRTLGHAWYEYDDSEWTPLFGTPLTLRCERCTGKRRDIIDGRGELGQRYYVMPEGYFYARGERPSKADFRLMLISQRVQKRRERRKAERAS